MLRRTARQRGQAQKHLADTIVRTHRLALAWASARRRAGTPQAGVDTPRQLHDTGPRWGTHDGRDILRENAMMRIELARCRSLVERAGWMPDAEPRRLWRWREGWWELAYRRRDIKDGYHDSGWYLWGPGSTYFGQWVGPLKNGAQVEADRLITKHFADIAEQQK